MISACDIESGANDAAKFMRFRNHFLAYVLEIEGFARDVNAARWVPMQADIAAGFFVNVCLEWACWQVFGDQDISVGLDLLNHD